MGWFTKLFALYGPRVIGSVAGAAATKIAEKTGIAVDPATLIGIGLAAYSAVHKAVSSKVNPGDTAEGRLAAANKVSADTGAPVKPVPPTS